MWMPIWSTISAIGRENAHRRTTTMIRCEWTCECKQPEEQERNALYSWWKTFVACNRGEPHASTPEYSRPSPMPSSICALLPRETRRKVSGKGRDSPLWQPSALLQSFSFPLIALHRLLTTRVWRLKQLILLPNQCAAPTPMTSLIWGQVRWGADQIPPPPPSGRFRTSSIQHGVWNASSCSRAYHFVP